MLLSTYRRRRYESDPGNYKPARVNGGTGTKLAARTHVGIGTEPGATNDAGVPTEDTTPEIEPQGGAAQLKRTALQSQDEFDEYGTELHPDARVWKMYVQETDRFDGELVKGWNDSTDVILIFAALFSAISTAFLIESSKMLQPDPTDVSARTLATISQVLLTLTNGSQLPGSVAAPPDNSAGFVPSPTAVCVNTLWYLSLSLSLATSFIAILSKDWCHSFMSGRTGHHYKQTCRRQQKWDMLERWKMSELLALLPSIIHLALLLFSVGLCILLWDMHSVVAVPVICVSAVAFGFYAWSSIAAIVMDSFPYPTIISVICRTKPARFVPRLMILIVPQVLRYLTWAFLYLILRPLEYLLHHLVEASEWLQDIDTDNTIVKALVCQAAYRVWDWLTDRSWYGTTTATRINGWFTQPEWIPEWTRAYASVAKLELNNVELQVKLPSLALSWIVKNCEVPRSVDIALQSIAGASQDFFREPLLQCNAAMEISKRLASSNSYQGGSTEIVVKLYSRALSFLSPSGGENLSNTHDAGDNIEVTIWRIQAQLENNVASWITDGQFQPSRHNLEALRIGNTAASRSLRLLQGASDDPSVLFRSITSLMEQHFSKAASLHPASLLSLVNATALLSLFYKDFAAILPIHRLCVGLASDIEHVKEPRLKMSLITCALIQRMHMNQERSREQPGDVSPARVIQILMEFQSHEDQDLSTMLGFGLGDLWKSEWLGHLDDPDSNVERPTGLSLQLLSGMSYILTGNDYDHAPSRLTEILHNLHFFTSSSSKLERIWGTDGGLIGSIWNLGREIERKLATLISDNVFNPSQNNLDALGLGSGMALASAKLLRKQLADGELEGIVNSIVALLKSHQDRTSVLHDAALLSVTYAAALISLISPTSINASQTSSSPLPVPQTAHDDPLKQSDELAADCHAVDAPTLSSLCRQLARDNSSVGLITVFAKTSLLWFNMHVDHTRANSSQTDELDWKVEVVRGLTEICSEDKKTIDVINDYIEPLIEATPTLGQASNLDLSPSRPDHDFLSNATKTTLNIPPITPPQLEEESGNELQKDVALQVRALCAIYRLAAVTFLYPDIYLSVVEIMCRTPPSSPLFARGAQMLSKCPFPTLSEELATALEQRDLVPLLETTSHSDNRTKQYFAQGQLWLLLSLYIYAGDTASGRDKLKTQLDKCGRNGGESVMDRYQRLGEVLYDADLYGPVFRDLGFWAHRLDECTSQFLDRTFWSSDQIAGVQSELRGLSSFTAWPRRAGDPSTNEPRPVDEVTDEARARTDATDLKTAGGGATGGDGQLQSTGQVADTGETGTQEEDDAGRTNSRQEIEAATQGPPVGDGKSLADVNSQEEVGEVRGEGSSGVEAVGDERRVVDADDATEATDGPHSESEEAESEDLTECVGNEGDVVIRMDRLVNRSDGSTTSA